MIVATIFSLMLLASCAQSDEADISGNDKGTLQIKTVGKRVMPEFQEKIQTDVNFDDTVISGFWYDPQLYDSIISNAALENYLGYLRDNNPSGLAKWIAMDNQPDSKVIQSAKQAIH